MAKRGGNRLKYQVEKAVNQINKIGISKKELRDSKQETGIHSIKQVEHVLSSGQNFAKWLKEEKKVKDLFQLKRVHYREYMEYMKTTGVSNGHLINTETNLRLLQKGMNGISEEKGFKGRDWCPKQRLVSVSDREQPVNRSISPEQYEEAKEKLSDSAKDGADLQQAFGLRLREVANTKVAHIVEKDGSLYWQAVADKSAINTAQGVTKAGRERWTPCKPEMENRVRELIAGKEESSFVLPIKYNTLKSAYYRAGIDGSHAFRHGYARDMVKAEFRRLGIEKEGRDMVQRMIENRSEGYRKDYRIEKSERALYQQAKGVIDKVHGYLGHGMSRSDLMHVYMS